MPTDRTIKSFQAEIIQRATTTLDRPLSEREQSFITQRCGFIVLEMIHDTVSAASAAELERYLNSE